MSSAQPEAGTSAGAAYVRQGSQTNDVRRDADPSLCANNFPLYEDLEAAWLIAAHALVERRYNVLDWFDDHSCHCTCPGDKSHSNRTADNHCRIYLDAEPVPTIDCQHQSCGEVIAAHNKWLRHLWRRAMAGNQLGLSPAETATLDKELRAREAEAAKEKVKRDEARAALKKLAAWAQVHRHEILKEHRWTAAEILADSPSPVPADPAEHWRLILSRYEPRETLWMADEVYYSGEREDGREFSHCFQITDYWLFRTQVPGVFICPAVLDVRATRRSNENVVRRPFIVVESDTLNRDEVGAVFQWLISQGLRLRFVVDTSRRSLHGWFEAPDLENLECLKAILPELGVDKKVLTMTQPVRLPGAINPKTGKHQRLIYCDLLP